MSRGRLVLHLSSAQFYRGGERQLAWLHEGLMQRGWSSALLCPAGEGLARRGLPQTHLCGRDPLGASMIGGILRLCRARPVGLVHCSDSRALTSGVLASLVTGVPVVATRRDSPLCPLL